jgi:hypothetical protein
MHVSIRNLITTRENPYGFAVTLFLRFVNSTRFIGVHSFSFPVYTNQAIGPIIHYMRKIRFVASIPPLSGTITTSLSSHIIVIALFSFLAG